MSKAFGTEFVLVNDVMQMLDPKVFQGGPWTHIATVVRGFKEYMAFKHETNHTIYIEELDSKEPNLLKQIEDTTEWADLAAFLVESGVLTISASSEIKLAKNMLFSND